MPDVSAAGSAALSARGDQPAPAVGCQRDTLLVETLAIPDDRFTRRTLRFAWHLTSIAWWGFAALLLELAWTTTSSAPPPAGTARIVALTFLASGTVAALASRGRHLSWPIFLAIGALAWLGA